MEKKQRSSSPIMWALKQTGEHRGRYVVSVVFAVVGVAFSLAPYFVIVDIVYGVIDEYAYGPVDERMKMIKGNAPFCNGCVYLYRDDNDEIIVGFWQYS